MIVRKMTIIFWSDATKFSLFRGRKKRRKNRQKQGGAVRRAGGWKCGAGGVRIATPACALVRNDMLQGSAAHIGRRSVVTPPYGCGTWGAVHAGRRGRRPPTQDKMIFTKNVIPRSTAMWESVFPVWQRCSVGVLRIANQPASWFAMTFLGSAAVVGGGTHGCRPTGAYQGVQWNGATRTPSPTGAWLGMRGRRAG